MKKLLWIVMSAFVGGLLAADKTITGNYVVAADGETYANVTVAATASITGGALTLESGGMLTISGGTATFASTVVMGENDGDAVTLAPAAGATALFTGKVTGSADIYISAVDKTGTVRFAPAAGVTSDFDGNLTVLRGTFRAKGDSALGSTKGTTTCVSAMTDGAYDNLIYFEGMTTGETIWLSRGDVGWSNVESIFFTGDCTFNGPICAPSAKHEFGWHFNDGITLTFNGGLGSAEKPYGHFMASEKTSGTANIVFNSSPYISATWYWMKGINQMNAPLLGNCALRFRGGRYFLNQADIFSSVDAKNVIFESSDTLVFNLVKGDQTFASFILPKNNAGVLTKDYSACCEITSSTGQTLNLVNTAGDSIYRGTFTGNVNFDVAGNKTVTLSGVSTTTGMLALSDEAKVVFAEGGFWRGGLSVANDDGTQTITLDNGGMTVSSLTVAGEKLSNGVYGATDSSAANKLPFLSGSGLLTVASIEDLVVTGGDYTVDSGGILCSNVRIEGDTTITGGALTLADGGKIIVAAGKSATFAGPVVMGQETGDAVTLAPAVGATALFTGKVTGPADISVSAADKTGTVRFAPAAGVTSDFDGNLTVVRGTFRAEGDSALGSTEGSTTCISTKTGNEYDNLIYFEGMTTDETIWLSRGKIGWSWDETIFFTGDCTFNGPICAPARDTQEYGWYFADGITLTFNGGLGSAEKPYWQLMGSEEGTCSANLVFNSPVYVENTWYWMNGVNHMNKPLVGSCTLRFRGGRYQLPVENVFVQPTGSSKVLIVNTGDALVFNLIGCDQLFSRIDGAKHSATMEVTSEIGGNLRLDGTGESVFHGRFTGSAGLSVEAAQCVILSGNNTSTGTLMLTNGAQVAFTGTGNWAGRIVVAGNGGEKVTINGLLSAAEVVVGGVALQPGYYGPDSPIEANRLSCLDGSGAIVVGYSPTTQATWDAEGGSSSPSVTHAANWSGDIVPDLSSGSASITFAAGDQAELDGDVFWKAIDFTAGLSSFRFFGNGSVALAGGLTMAEGSTSLELDSPVCTIGSQTWTLPETATMTLRGKLSGHTGSTVTLSGAGTYVFTGADSDTGADFRSTDTASIHMKSANALGTTAGSTTIASAGPLMLDNVRTDEPFVLSGTEDRYGTHVWHIPGTNVLNGRITVTSPVYIQKQRNGSRLVVAGGIDFNMAASYKRFQIAWFGKGSDTQPFQFEIKDVPVVNSGSKAVTLYNECVCDVIVSVAGNRFSPVTGSDRSVIQMTRNDKNAAGEPTARLICKVPYAFNYADILLLGVNVTSDKYPAYCGLIDLCGNDQGFAEAYGLPATYQEYTGYQEANGVPQGAHSIVKSSGGPAYLCSRHKQNAATWWTFTGAAGYRMEGSGGITFMTSSQSTGALCVTNGTMTIPAGVAWRRCSKVIAEENGTFVLDGSIGTDTEVHLSGNGKLHLQDGVSARAGCLVLDGSMPLFGEWGSPESGANNTSTHFTGTGRIRFGSPLRIIIR